MPLRTLLVAFLLALPAFAAPAAGPFSAIARSDMADLLRIPPEPPAVSATVASSKLEDGIAIDDIWWLSPEGERVEAYLLRPAGSTGRLPAVICLHGTSTNRDVAAAARYEPGPWTRYGTTHPSQTLFGWAREMARHGYVTLALTQLGLDRRLPGTEARQKELLLEGRNVMGLIIQEIRQSVTYLAARPEVDPDRLGITGISFGGITSFYTWIVDPRVSAAAPICGGVGSVREFLRHGQRGYHGIYWWIPGMLTRGDHGDFAAAMAPRPLLLWAPRADIGMPNQGIDRFLEAALPAYRQAGAADRLVVHRPPGEHALTRESVSAVLEFFNRVLR
jgi:dienelactone hydrolase